MIQWISEIIWSTDKTTLAVNPTHRGDRPTTEHFIYGTICFLCWINDKCSLICFFTPGTGHRLQLTAWRTAEGSPYSPRIVIPSASRLVTVLNLSSYSPRKSDTLRCSRQKEFECVLSPAPLWHKIQYPHFIGCLHYCSDWKQPTLFSDR